MQATSATTALIYAITIGDYIFRFIFQLIYILY